MHPSFSNTETYVSFWVKWDRQQHFGGNCRPRQADLPDEELYCEPFSIPKPDDVVFMGWFEGGAVFRSGCTFTRGYGKIFYFQPGHEENRVYDDPGIRKILINAVRWAAPKTRLAKPEDNFEIKNI